MPSTDATSLRGRKVCQLHLTFRPTWATTPITITAQDGQQILKFFPCCQAPAHAGERGQFVVVVEILWSDPEQPPGSLSLFGGYSAPVE